MGVLAGNRDVQVVVREASGEHACRETAGAPSVEILDRVQDPALCRLEVVAAAVDGRDHQLERLVQSGQVRVGFDDCREELAVVDGGARRVVVATADCIGENLVELVCLRDCDIGRLGRLNDAVRQIVGAVGVPRRKRRLAAIAFVDDTLPGGEDGHTDDEHHEGDHTGDNPADELGGDGGSVGFGHD